MPVSVSVTPEFFSLGVTSSLFVAVVVSLLWLWRRKKSMYSNPSTPPCPVKPWPVLGHLPMFRDDFRAKMEEWREQYGGIYLVYFGRDAHVVVGDFGVLKEIMTKHSNKIVNTAHSLIVDVLKEHNTGIVTARDDNWKVQRSTTISILRSLGMGNDVMAVRIQAEVCVLLEALTDTEGRPVDLRQLLINCMTNIMSSMILGDRFHHDDPRLVRLVGNVSDILRYAANVILLTSLRALVYCPGDLFHIKKWARAARDLTEFIRTYVATSSQPSESCDPRRTFITAYLEIMKETEHTEAESYLNEANLKAIVRVLFVAGTESTASTLLWCLLYMLHYPQVQENIYKELKVNIESNRLPNMADKTKLVYLNAVILETQRIVSVIPTSQRREVSKSFEVHGFTIPKGSIIWPLNFLIHHDKDIWGDPERFRPERFIGSNGSLVIPEQLIAFGIGKRICIGEGLARMELFLFLAAMCQRFKFEPGDTSGSLPTLESSFAAVCCPRDFPIRAVRRDPSR